MSQYAGEHNGLYQGQPQGSYYHEAPQFAHGQQGRPSPYESHQQYGENASYYHDNGAVPGAEGPENEKGLGSTVAGGAAGGYATHHMGGGKLATAGGAVLGAVGMNVVSHKLKQHSNQQPAQTFTGGPVVGAPAPGTTTVTTTTTTGDGLGGRLGLGGGLGGGLVGGRARQRIARRRLGL